MHKFIPLNNGKIKVFETSHADEGDEKQILKHGNIFYKNQLKFILNVGTM